MPLTIRKLGDRKRVRQEQGPEESQVQQHLAAETDINNIMAKYVRTGQFHHVSAKAAQYGDFSEVPDYKTAMEHIMAADALFMELPAKVRDRFNNDPAQFVEFTTDPANIDEVRKLGLAPAAPQEPEPPIVKGPKEPKAPEPNPSP